jgi:hypothetical protein
VRRRFGAEPEAVHEARLGGRVEGRKHPAQAGEVRPMQPGAIDLGGRRHPNDDALGRCDDRGKEMLALLGHDLLGVVQASERPHGVIAQTPVVEQHSGHDERPGEGATTGFVGPCDEPDTEPPVEAKEALTAR